MYRIYFHNADPKRILYIFKVVDGVVQSSSGTYQWTDIKGDSIPVMLRFDELEENGIFTPIVKTSLQVRLKRLNEEDYTDIIDSDDNLWMAVVLQNAELALNYDYTPIIVYDNETEGENVLFKGLLTLETYGEDFAKFTDVVLTFHDRLGDLQDLDFDPKEAYLPITTILATCLYSCTCSEMLYLEFPYDIDFTNQTSGLTYKSLKTPSNYLIDVSSYVSKKCYEVLTDILVAHGFRLYCDFNEHRGNTLSDYGAIRVEYIGNLKNDTFEYYYFDRTLEVESEFSYYDYINTENSSGGNAEPVSATRTVIDMDSPTTYPIRDQGGNWELTRKAKAIKGATTFEIRDNLIFPEEFLLEDFTYVGETEYELEYRIWGAKGISFVPPYGYFYQKANRVGNLLKLGLLVFDYTSYTNLTTGIMKKLRMEAASVTFSLSAELWANITGPVYFVLMASRGIGKPAYYYNNVTGDWQSYVTSYPCTLTENDYTDFTLADIPSPTQMDTGEIYDFWILVSVDALITPLIPVEGDMIYLTEVKLQATSALEVYPSKVTINTLLGETRRKSVEFTVSIYNLPEIEGTALLYYNGIFATGMDIIEDSSTIDPSTDKVVPVPTLILNSNSATLLVHLTDMYGLQYLFDRWKFDCILLELPNNTFQEILFFEEEFTDAFVDGLPAGWTQYSITGTPELTQVDSTYMQVDVHSGEYLRIDKTFSERYGRIRVEIKAKKVGSGFHFDCMLLLQKGSYELLQFYTNSSEIVFTGYVDVLQSNPIVGVRLYFSATNTFLIDYVHLTKTS